MPVNVLQASATKTGAFNGTGLDISTFSKNAVARIRITALTAAKNVVFALQDSVDGFSSDTRTLKTFAVLGPVSSVSPRELTVSEFEMPSVRYGTGSATMRLAVLSIDGSSSVTYEGFVQS